MGRVSCVCRTDRCNLQDHRSFADGSNGTLAEQEAVDFGLFEVSSYSLIDGPGNDLRVLRFAVADLRRLAAQGPVLVQCHAGRSRSVVVVAGYLMEMHCISARETIARVAAKRDVNVTPALAELLQKLEI